jgi:hypothetical protein
VRLRRATVGVGDLGDRLASTRRTSRLSMVVDALALGPLRLRAVTLHKSGSRLTGSATVSRADLSSALPVDLGLHPVASGGGALVMEADVGPVAVRARLSAQDGELRIAPEGLLGGFASVTVFSDPRVRVLGVGARSTAGGFTFTARGALTAK